jgi:hypothetical protein
MHHTESNGKNQNNTHYSRYQPGGKVRQLELITLGIPLGNYEKVDVSSGHNSICSICRGESLDSPEIVHKFIFLNVFSILSTLH